MAKVSIVNVEVLDAEAPFSSPYRFRITFDANEELPEDLEWKVTYVGCAESNDYDQVLDSVLVGPVPCGRHVFVFDAPAPDATRIPSGELIGVTVVLLTCSYREQEFVRIGYFVRVEYDDVEMRENPPAQPVFERLMRVLLADSPRVTRLTINWNGAANVIDGGDLGIDGATTSGITVTEAAGSARDEEAAVHSAPISATDQSVNGHNPDTEKLEKESSTCENELCPPKNGDALPEAERKQESILTHATNGDADATVDQRCSSQSHNGKSDNNGETESDVLAVSVENADDVARKRLKMDEANANANPNGLTLASERSSS